MAVSLPVTMTFPNVAVTLSADPTMGVVLDTIQNTTSAFTWSVSASGLHDLANRSVWSLQLRKLTDVFNPSILDTRQDDGFTVDASSARSFEIEDVSTLTGYTEAYLARWSRVGVEGAEDLDEFTVEVLFCRETPTTDKLTVECRVVRQRGASVTLDSVRCPQVVVEMPTAPRAAETFLQASARTRVLVPSNLAQSHPGGLGSNVPMVAWSLDARDRVLEHPGPLQPLPFSAICCADEQDASSYLQFLQMQAEDVDGYVKRFRYRALADANPQTEQLFLMVHEYVPAYVRHQAAEVDRHGSRPETWTHNDFLATYKVALTAGRALTAAFWADCAGLYRSWARSAYSVPEKATALSRLANDPTLFWAINTFSDVYLDDAEVRAAAVLDRAAQFEVDLEGVSSPKALSFESQCSLPKGFGLVPGAGIDGPGFPAELADSFQVLPTRLRGRELLVDGVATYLRPTDIPSHQSRGVLGQAARIRVERNSLPDTRVVIDPGTSAESSLKTKWLDPADPSFEEFLSRECCFAVARAGWDAFYLDTFGGNYMSHPSGPGRTHEAHGGSYSTSAVREASARLKADYAPPWLGNETFTEQVLGLVDWTQEGYGNPVGYLALAEEAGDSSGLLYRPMSESGYPAQSRDPQPPLVSFVWGRHHTLWRLVMTLTRTPLSSSPLHPGSGGEAGLTEDQLTDLHCMLRGSLFCGGISPLMLESYLGEYDDPLRSGDGGVGDAVWGFLRSLYDWWSQVDGFWARGEMLRPLEVDLLAVDSQQNPVYVADQNVYQGEVSGQLQSARIYTMPTAMAAGSLPTLNFAVPQVLHNVWLDPASGQTAVVCCNWSGNGSASWKGTLDTSVYGGGDLFSQKLGEAPVSEGTLLAGTSYTLGVNDGTADFSRAVGARELVVWTIVP